MVEAEGGDALASAGPTRVGLLGLFGVPNYGNQASLEVAVEILRRRHPDWQLVCICAGTETVTEELGIPAVSLPHTGLEHVGLMENRLFRVAMYPFLELVRWIAATRTARRLSVIVVPGTGLLDDFGERPHRMPLTLFRWSFAARLTRTPIVLASVGAGPINHPANRKLMTAFARAARLRTYRDIGSASFMGGLGAPGAVTPDVVFARPVDVEVQPQRPRPLVGVGVMAYFGWSNDSQTGGDVFEHYVERMVAVVEGLLDRGFDVRLLVGESSDLIAVESVSRRIAAGHPDAAERVEVPVITNYSGVVANTADTDAVIAIRYHGLVAALMCLRPTVAIQYSAKHRDLMTSFGIGEYCHDVDDFDVETVLNDLDRVRSHWHELAPAVSLTIPAWASEVERLFADDMATVF